MDHVEQQLSARLYRRTCPAATDLGQYHLQMLTDEQQTAVAHHLRICPHCQQELAQLQTFLRELAPELHYSLREKMQIWIAQRLPAARPDAPGFAPALALRGDAAEPLMYEAGDYQLNLEIQDDPAKPGHKAILGLVMGMGDEAFQAQLWLDGHCRQTTAVDNLGNFIFAAISPGQYDLILNRLTAEIHVQSVTV